MFTADLFSFYHHEKAFTPLLNENVVVIPLSARLSADLKWETEVRSAEKACEEGKFLLWELDLGLDGVDLRDSAAFFALSIALEEFAKSIYSRFKENTFGVVLYRGDCDFRAYVPLKVWEDSFEEFLGELKDKAPEWHELHSGVFSSHYHALFGAQVVAEYLQRLISFLPEELLVFAFFDRSNESSLSLCAQKLSRERFEFLHEFERELSSPLGVCLPTDAYLDARVGAELDALFFQLKEKGRDFRIIPEAKLTEEWNGVDELVILSDTISPWGKRKLQGFIAAGGMVLDGINFF